MNAVPSDFSFQRPGGFHASGLARKAIAQCGATIAKTIFEIDCAWYSSFKFILGVSQVVAYIVFREFRSSSVRS